MKVPPCKNIFVKKKRNTVATRQNVPVFPVWGTGSLPKMTRRFSTRPLIPGSEGVPGMKEKASVKKLKILRSIKY